MTNIPALPRLDNTLGAAFLGNLTAAIFYGITNVQTFIYFTHYWNDGVFLKSLVTFLWVLDGLHLALISHAVYFYLITNFSNILAVADLTWSISAHVIVTSVSDLVVRCYFGRRVWRLSGGNLFLAIPVYGVSLVVFASGVAFASKSFILKTYAKFDQISWILYLSLGSAVVADAIIAISLCVILMRKRTGFKRTDGVLKILMAYTINTGLLTSICAATCFITYAVMPHNFVFIAFYFVLSKLYLNSLLATLNARSSLRERSEGGVVSFPLTSGLNSGSRSENARKSIDPSHSAPLTISIETITDRKTDSIGVESWKTPILREAA